VDLILSMRQRRAADPQTDLIPSGEEVEHAVSLVLADRRADSPSHLCLELLRRGIAAGWDLSGLDLRLVTQALRAQGWSVDPASGRLLQMASSL
jgi:hypothetical protein